MGDVSSTPSDPFSEPPAVPHEPSVDPMTVGDVSVGDLPPGVSEVFIEPEDPKKGRKGVLVGVGAALLVVAAIVVAIFVAGSGDSDAYSLKAAAQGAAEAKNVAFEMKATAAGEDLTMAARLDADRQLMAMSIDMPALSEGGSIDAVMDMGAKVMYMDASAIPGAGEIPTKWISIDLSTMPGAEESFGSLTSSNPLDTAALFENASAVVDKGVEEVGGEKVKHYVVTVKVDDLVAKQPGLGDQFDSLGGTLPETVDYEVWVTEGNELRRMSFTLDVAGQTVVTDMKVTAIGTIDPIDIPAADDVTDMSKLLGG